jgi:gas vesicle protein
MKLIKIIKTFYQRLNKDNFASTLICTLIGTFVGAYFALVTAQHFQDKADEKERQQIEARAKEKQQQAEAHAKEDLRQQIEFLKDELKENKNLLQNNGKKYNEATTLFFFEYHKSGFEMLKSSGIMRQIEDKTLLSSILRIYSNLEDIKQAHEYYLNDRIKGVAVQKQSKTVENRIDNLVIRLDSLLNK